MGIWGRFKSMVGRKPPANVMGVSALTQMRKEVTRLGFSVFGGDSCGVGVRENVGVLVPKGTADKDVQSAVKAFVAAADIIGLCETRVPRHNVPVYVEGDPPVCG